MWQTLYMGRSNGAMLPDKLQLVVHFHHNMKLQSEDVCRMDVWAFFVGGVMMGEGGVDTKGIKMKKS